MGRVAAAAAAAPSRKRQVRKVRTRPILTFATGVRCSLAMKTLILLVSLMTLGSAQTYKPSEANLKARQWFQDSKFGLFIHWGVYSVLGDGEWVMNNKKMTVAEYEPLAARFNPTEFDAAEWDSLARAAGMKYITITSKHHD